MDSPPTLDTKQNKLHVPILHSLCNLFHGHSTNPESKHTGFDPTLGPPSPQISPCGCGKTAQWAKRLQHKHIDLNLDPPHSHPKLAVGASIGNIIAHCIPKSLVSSPPTMDSNGDSMVAFHMSSLPVPHFPFVHPEVSPHPPTRT